MIHWAASFRRREDAATEVPLIHDRSSAQVLNREFGGFNLPIDFSYNFTIVESFIVAMLQESLTLEAESLIEKTWWDYKSLIVALRGRNMCFVAYSESIERNLKLLLNHSRNF